MATAGFMRAALFGAAVVALCAGAAEPAPQAERNRARVDARHPIAVSDITLPDPAKLLFWTPEQQRFGYRNMERFFPGHVVARGKTSRPLPRAGEALAVRYPYVGETWDTDRFMAHNRVAGLLVLHDGRIVLERYALGLSETGRWTSFSMAKSITSTLVGAALKDGHIKSLEDPVTRYLPALKGTAYDGVSLRHLLTMTSGVRWNENYADPKSDVNRLAQMGKAAAQGQAQGQATPGDGGPSTLVAFMAKLPRAHAPGTVFNYNTAETGLLGEVLHAATGKPVAAYLSEKLWVPLGMEQDAFWVTDRPGPIGRAVTGCCLSASLRDYGRFGQFMLEGGAVDGKPLLPQGWLEAAARPAPSTGKRSGGQGYGYQWWTVEGGGFEARGVFGQNIRIWPEKRLVVVTLSAWPQATDPERGKARLAYIRAVAEAVAERAETGAGTDQN